MTEIPLLTIAKAVSRMVDESGLIGARVHFMPYVGSDWKEGKVVGVVFDHEGARFRVKAAHGWLDWLPREQVRFDGEYLD